MKIVDKIAKKMSQARINKVFDLGAMNSAHAELDKIHKKLIKNFATYNYDPSHKIYILLQNYLSLFGEEFSDLTEFKEFAETFYKLDRDYRPPSGPISLSYFNCLMLCDFTFGKEKESIVSIFLDLFEAQNMDINMCKGLKELKDSYMTFYLHKGFEGDLPLWQEIMTGHTYDIVCPAGYLGRSGDIIFCRLVSNLDEVYKYKICLTTPYLIKSCTSEKVINYFKQHDIRRESPDFQKNYLRWLKHHPKIRYWSEYLIKSFIQPHFDHINLSGLPRE